MTRVIAVVAIVCACLLLWSGMFHGPDRLRVSTIAEPTLLTIVITFPSVTDSYRWLSVHGCSATVTEHGAWCTGDFERESSLELFGRKQELLYWRHLPPGTLLLTAQAFDRESHVLASGTTVVFRGR